MRKIIGWLTATSVLVLLTTTVALAEKENITVEQTPQVVLDACMAKYPGAKITQVEILEDQSGYNIDIEFEGYEIETDFTNDGKFVYSEKEITLKELPEAIVAALKKGFPGRELGTFELCLTADGKVTYEIDIEPGEPPENVEIDVVMDPAGNILSQKEDHHGKEPGAADQDTEK